MASDAHSSDDPDDHQVIVIDGDPAVRDGLATLLALENYKVTTYPTAAAFLDETNSEPFELVICEADLPDRPGLEVFHYLRSRHPEARFALLVSRKNSKLVERAMEIGVRDVLVKPLVHRSVLEFIKRPKIIAS